MRWLLAAAALLAIGLIVAGVTAGRTLEARDEAVRDGLLTRSAHAIERELREQGPDEAAVVLRRAVQADASVVALELRRAGVVVARGGDVSRTSPRTFPLFLGPSWRDVGGVPHLAGRGQAPFELLIWPTPDAGDASRVAAFATWGSVTGALALLAFAIVAARGIKARHDAATSEAERRRLEVVSAAGAGLAHRVAVVRLEIPPLRERLDDIPPVARHLLQRLAQKHGVAVPELTREALEALRTHTWPGNVRELRNVLERALVLRGAEPIRPTDLAIATVSPTLARSHDEVEKERIVEALRQTHGNRERAAQLLGVSVRTLYYRLNRLGLG